MASRSMNKRRLNGVGTFARASVGGRGLAMLAALTALSFLMTTRAQASPRSGPSVSQAIPLQWSGRAPSPWPCWIKPVPVTGPVGSPPAQRVPRPIVSPARLQYLKRQERLLRRRIWRLRLRRRTFLAEGRPQHVHRVNQRILSLGWRLRRVQAAERGLGGQ